MPELPEVENVRRYLVEAGLPGRAFTGVRVGWARTVQTPALEEFVLTLPGSRVQRVCRRAKYILLPLDTGSTFILHLGMAGRLRLQPASEPEPPMLRHAFALDDGRELRFIDPRKFGKLWLAANPADVLPPLGPEPLKDGFTPDLLAQRLAGHNIPIKALLLEQSAVAGLGNLYADESLYLAGIHPLRPASGLSQEEVARLRDSIIAALTSAVAQYDRGRLEHWPDPPMALDTWTVPRGNGQTCPRCGAPITGLRVRGRSTYFCPQCQG